MPEGPEVRREADRIESAIADAELLCVEFGLPRLQRWQKVLAGSRVTALQTRGKALLTHFDNGYSMYSHNQLYGKWVVGRANRLPASNRSLRVGLHTASHSAVLYSASDIEIMDTRSIGEHPFLRRLGPDVLDGELTWRDVAARLRDPQFSGRSAASLYLDQGFLAGIGNYMRSEILHDALVHPMTRPRDLSLGQIGTLARSTLLISHRAYDQAGVTNRPARVRSLKKLGYPRRDYRFSVFAREGLPCYRCATPITRIEVSSRRLYLCSACQVPVKR